MTTQNITHPATAFTTPVRTYAVNTRFSVEEVSIIDREAARFGVSRSELIRTAVGRLVASLPATTNHA